MKKNLYTAFNELECFLFEKKLDEAEKVIQQIQSDPTAYIADTNYRLWVDCFIESMGVSDKMTLTKALARPLPEKIVDYLMRFDLNEGFTIENMAKHLQSDISTPETLDYFLTIFDAVAKKLEKEGWKFQRKKHTVYVKQRV